MLVKLCLIIKAGEQKPFDILEFDTANLDPSGARVDEFPPDLTRLHDTERAREF